MDHEYDVVLVATEYASSVYNDAKLMGYDLSKFIFLYNNYVFNDLNSDYGIVEDILPGEFIEYLRNQFHVVHGMSYDILMSNSLNASNMFHGGMYDTDYVRLRTFDLCRNEICNSGIEGAIAELGVFRGDFAQYLNRSFPDRRLYLFDTFEGFDDIELKADISSDNCDDAFIERKDRFSMTSEDIVLEKMDYPKNVVIKKGLFPDSLNGLEDTFAFVSLDADLEIPIYNGLEYFYPRLSEGGYIFIHDFNTPSLTGAKKAVNRFENKYDIRLIKCPIPDVEGTLIVSK